MVRLLKCGSSRIQGDLSSSGSANLRLNTSLAHPGLPHSKNPANLPSVNAGTKVDGDTTAQRQRSEFLSVTHSHESTVIKRVADGLGHFFEPLVSQRADC
jgi:hypothetical protein